MARPKNDNRRRQKTAKTRLQKTKRGSYSNYEDNQDNLKKALLLVKRGQSIRKAEKLNQVPKSTIMNIWKQYETSNVDVDEFLKT